MTVAAEGGYGTLKVSISLSLTGVVLVPKWDTWSLIWNNPTCSFKWCGEYYHDCVQELTGL